MDGITLTCENCDRTWTLRWLPSFYEQQALETRPCPYCGLYTLSCHVAEEQPYLPAMSKQ